MSIEHDPAVQAAAADLAPRLRDSDRHDLEVLPAADTAPSLGDRSPDDCAEHWAEALAPSLLALSDPNWWNADNGADWLLEPLIAAGRQTAIVAAPKVGKSLVMLEAAAALASGRAYLAKPASEPVSVVYCDLEMTGDDVRERLVDLGYGPGDDLGDHLHYYALPNLPPLDTAAGGSALVAVASHHRARLVVVDTMSRAIVGEENSADTLASFFRYSGGPLKAAGIALVRLDHSGHQNTDRARGSSAKAADVDVVFALTATDNGLAFKRTHQRVGWIPERVALRRHVDPLRHELVDGGWPQGTAEVAALLDGLGVPLGASRRAAQAALKAGGQPRRSAVVGAALRYRALQAEGVAATVPRGQSASGTTRGTTSRKESGTTRGTTSQDPRDCRAEPLREPPGTTHPGPRDTWLPPKGEPVASPDAGDPEDTAATGPPDDRIAPDRGAA